MSRVRTVSLAVAVLLAAVATGWLAGRATAPDDAADAAARGTPAAARKVLYYRNPMGLPDTSPVPKKDPMGMDYLPVHAGEEAPAVPGAVVLSPDKVQALGVRTEPARRSPLASRVQASGTVQLDETRQYAIAPRFEGWVETLHANQTGMRVRRGQPLLAVYSPQLAAVAQEYRLADAAARTLAPSDPASAASMTRLRDAARTRLRNWNIDASQIGNPARSGHAQTFVLTSPADAVVIDKPIVQGARFEPGETILRLADLSTVWVIAKVPVAQSGDIALGQPARFESVALPGASFDGSVAFVQPMVDARTRTVDVRIVLPNPDEKLRPGLFGTVLLEQTALQPVLTIPRSAVLETGTRQVALVQTGPGRFAPRAIMLGRRAGGRVEVLDGLVEGDAVVVSANFLIDAESNLQSALQGLVGHAGHGTPAGDAAPARVPSSEVEPAPLDPHAGHDRDADAPVATDAPATEEGRDEHEGH